MAINADGAPCTAHFDADCGMAVDLITGAAHDFGGGSELPALQLRVLEDGTLTPKLTAARPLRRFPAGARRFLQKMESVLDMQERPCYS